MLAMDDINAYLGIDYTDEATETNLNRCLATAQSIVKSSIGADVYDLLDEDSKLDELTLLYIDELYSNRGLESNKVSSSLRRLVSYMELELQLELKAAREEAEEE